MFFVPETKGRTLEEMDELFGSTGMAASDEERKLRIEGEIGLLALVGVESPVSEKNQVEQHAGSEEFVEAKN